MIQRAVNTYRNAYDDILHRILRGNLIHSDETHVSVKGKDSYVWVFTSMEEVIYIWSETREGLVATDFSKISRECWCRTFIPFTTRQTCPQQKCLIHLMRDLNDDVHREPFNLEMKEVAHGFGDNIEIYNRYNRSLRLEKLLPEKTQTSGDTVLQRPIPAGIFHRI